MLIQHLRVPGRAPPAVGPGDSEEQNPDEFPPLSILESSVNIFCEGFK